MAKARKRQWRQERDSGDAWRWSRAASREPPEVARASAYEVAQRQLDEVAGSWGLRTMSSAICACQRELIVHFPVRMDDDRVKRSSRASGCL